VAGGGRNTPCGALPTGSAGLICPFRTEGVHGARPTYRRGRRGRYCACGMLGRLANARLDAVYAVGATDGDFAVRIRTDGRRCAHPARRDLSYTLLAAGAAGEPVGDVYDDRFFAADGDGRTARPKSFHFRQRTPGRFDTQSGRGESPTAAAAGEAEAATAQTHREEQTAATGGGSAAGRACRPGRRAAASTATRRVAIPAAPANPVSGGFPGRSGLYPAQSRII
jgi:hypothetical protein